MRIKIKENASDILRSRGGCRDSYLDIIKEVEGSIMEVETEYLFKDQFNTVPIPGIAENGIRIMESLVEDVIDDIRPFRQKCNYCGYHCPTNRKFCPNCTKTEYLERLAPPLPNSITFILEE